VASHVTDRGVAFAGAPLPRNMLERKSFDAPIAFTPPSDDKPYGGFVAVASDDSLDRDGERLLRSEWVTPLPDRITLDTEHGMSVGTTIGSAHPYFANAVILDAKAFGSAVTAVLNGQSPAAAIKSLGGDAAMVQAIHDASGHLGAVCVASYEPDNWGDDGLTPDEDDDDGEGVDDKAFADALRLRLKALSR
jgi:hypothetical protein